MATALASSSARVLLSRIRPARVTLEGSVILSIWTRFPDEAATAAYVWPPDSNVAMPSGQLRLLPSEMLPVAVRVNSTCIA